MNKLILVLAMVVSSSVFAAQKSYDCKPEGTGDVSPDSITVVAYLDNAGSDKLVFSFRGWLPESYSQPVAERQVGQGDNGGATFELVKNVEAFLNQKNYKVTKVRANNGIMRMDNSGALKVWIDETTTPESGSWSRNYACTAR